MTNHGKMLLQLMGGFSVDRYYNRGIYGRKELILFVLAPLLLRGWDTFSWGATELLNNLAEMEPVDGKSYG